MDPPRHADPRQHAVREPRDGARVADDAIDAAHANEPHVEPRETEAGGEPGDGVDACPHHGDDDHIGLRDLSCTHLLGELDAAFRCPSAPVTLDPPGAHQNVSSDVASRSAAAPAATTAPRRPLLR